MTILQQDVLHELKDLLGPDFSLFLQTFRSDLDARCEAMSTALDADNAHALRHAAHSLKGSSVNLGAHPLADLCSNIEAAAVSGDLDQVPALFARVQALRQQVHLELERETLAL